MSKLAQWTGKNQSGEIAAWAGDGRCEVLGIDDNKRGFGIGDAETGPAVHVLFAPRGPDGAKYDAWLPPYEVVAVQ